MLLIRIRACNGCKTYAREVAKELLPDAIAKSLAETHGIKPSDVVVLIDDTNMNDVHTHDKKAGKGNLFVTAIIPDVPDENIDGDTISRFIKMKINAFLKRRSKQPEVKVITILANMGSAG